MSLYSCVVSRLPRYVLRTLYKSVVEYLCVSSAGSPGTCIFEPVGTYVIPCPGSFNAEEHEVVNVLFLV